MRTDLLSAGADEIHPTDEDKLVLAGDPLYNP